MTIDRALAEALEAAALEEGQPMEVARRLRAWIEALAAGGVGEEQRRFHDNLGQVLATEIGADED